VGIAIVCGYQSITLNPAHLELSPLDYLYGWICAQPAARGMDAATWLKIGDSQCAQKPTLHYLQTQSSGELT